MFPIPGTTRAKNAQDNIDAAKVKLSGDELKEIKTILDTLPVVGGRYDQGHLNLISQAF